MKPTFTKTLMGAALCLVLSATQSKALSYTAAVSGNYSSGATWVGGIAPPALLLANSISIPPNITVTLDVNLVVSNNTSLIQLSGTGRLVASGKQYLSYTNGDITADNISLISVDSIYIGPNADFSNYGGSLIGNKVTLSGASLSGSVYLQAKDNLFLETPGSSINGSSDVELGVPMGATRPWLTMRGGDLTAGVGSNITLNPFDLRYEAMANIGMGFELPHDSLVDIEIALPTASTTVTMATDIDIHSKLRIISGGFNLSGFKLSLMDSATIGGAGDVYSDMNSEFHIASTATDVGTLKFGTGGEVVGKFTMQTPTAASVLKLGSIMTIENELSLQSGVINAQGNILSVRNNTGYIIGGSANSYIITEAGGALRREVLTDSTRVYHIGTINGYAPVRITSVGKDYGELTINVVPGVLSNVTTGADMAATRPLVNATWTTSHPGTQTNVKYDIEPMWDASMEVNSFDRSKSYVTKGSTGNGWESGTYSAASMQGSLYSNKKSNVESFGPFGVFDLNTINVTDVTTGKTIQVYPNPATDKLHFVLENNKEISATVYSTTGQALNTTVLNAANNNINIAQLPAGMYYVQLQGEGVKGTAKFVKQ